MWIDSNVAELLQYAVNIYPFVGCPERKGFVQIGIA